MQRVWTLENGNRIKAESLKRGKYVKIKLASSKETVCIKYEKRE